MILQSHPEWQMGNIVMAIFVPLEEGYSLELPYPMVTPLPLPQKEANISNCWYFPMSGQVLVVHSSLTLPSGEMISFTSIPEAELKEITAEVDTTL